MINGHFAIWLIVLLSTACILFRPFRLPEYNWAMLGSLLLLAFGLISLHEASIGVLKGLDVYFFLIGMMLLAELAQKESLFDWLAAKAVTYSGKSSVKLFTLVYCLGTVVTIFLSNDATAVVLTPAVAAITKSARIKNPIPYLLICAFIANAASFVLPISNPANLVIYGEHLPSLLEWIPRYALASAVAIISTYWLLRLLQKDAIKQDVTLDGLSQVSLSRAGKLTGWGLLIVGVILLTVSALGYPLGLPTFLAAIVTAVCVFTLSSTSPWSVLKSISWSVIPLVAGLFIFVEALTKTGAISTLVSWLQTLSSHSIIESTWISGTMVAIICNLINNLPAGLIAGTVLQTAHVAESVNNAILVGVDLGPNLSVTGSLATILWLNALRREGLHVSAWDFLKLGAIIMPVSLLLTLLTISLVHP